MFMETIIKDCNILSIIKEIDAYLYGQNQKSFDLSENVKAMQDGKPIPCAEMGSFGKRNNSKITTTVSLKKVSRNKLDKFKINISHATLKKNGCLINHGV
jgi:hypothetical protein